jgi:16S rRNA processing protein RimM
VDFRLLIFFVQAPQGRATDMSTEYRNIGKLVAVFGLQGELILAHRLGKKTGLKGLKTIFIEENKDEMLPWFIESARIKSPDEIFLKLEGIDSKETARRVAYKEVWLSEADFASFAGRSAPISLVGFQVVQGKERLGEVLEVIEQPHQILCRIDLNGKEALIPVHEASLVKLDKKKREVHVSLPEGLLDIYR